MTTDGELKDPRPETVQRSYFSKDRPVIWLPIEHAEQVFEIVLDDAIANGAIRVIHFGRSVPFRRPRLKRSFLDGTQDGSTACGNTFTGYSAAGFFVDGVDAAGTSSTYSTHKQAFTAMSDVARSDDFIKARAKNVLSGSFFTVT